MALFRRPLAAACSLLLLAALPAAAETVTTRHDGTPLRGELRQAPERPLSAGVVLMVHGTKGHSGMPIIRKAADRFKARGWSSLAVTLSLGRPERSGFMPCDGVHDHRHADAVAEIGAWLDWLADRGAGPVVLLGHSRGGNQAAWYAAERAGSAVDATVLLAPMTWDPERAAAGYKERFGTPLPPLLAEAREKQSDAVMEVPGFLHCDGPTRVTARAFTSYYGDDRRKDTPTLLPEIEVPTLVMVGESDQRVPDLARRLPGLPQAGPRETVILEGTGHRFRKQLTTAIDRAAAFLAEHGVGAGPDD